VSDPALFDVAVIGGGPAGIAAALAASRQGARTLLAERDPLLGGNASAALVHTICGLYLPAGDGPAEYAHAGLPRRFAEGLRAAGGAGAPERAGRVWFLPTRPPVFADYAAKLCAACHELDVRTGTALVGARLAADAESELELACPDGRHERVGARIVIDTTGDAAAADLGGAELGVDSGDALQHPSYIFEMADVDTAELVGFTRLQLSYAVASAVRRGDLPPGCESVVARASGEPGTVYVTLGVPKLPDRPYAPLDPEYRQALEAAARRRAEDVARFLRDTRPAFRGSQVSRWPQRIGIRETRRLRGRVELDRDHVLRGRRCDDEVAVSTWPIEIWRDHRRASFEYPESPCSVPLAALVSRSHSRLGMAGRCLSASHEAHGALRVIGTSMATGEAVGTAAALAAEGDLSLAEIAPARVRATLSRESERETRR